MKALLKERFEDELGQSMILFAVLGSVLMLTMGLAIEGGNLFTQYRHMQSAADMAALVGAQDLPCTVGSSSCMTTAEQDACNYASDNGFTGCTPNGGSAPAAYVPPQSCSPYDFIDYGNGSTNTSCKSASAPTAYYYIEVQLTQPVFKVPIFNVNVTLYTHAVARRHAPTPGDFALITLNPNPSSLTIGGSSTVEIGGSVMSNGTITVNGSAGSFTTCDGGWNTAATQSAPSQLQSDTSGTQSYAPAQCTGGTTGATDFQSQQQPIQDPYLGTQPPPSSMTGTTGWYYQWTDSGGRSHGTWHQATSALSFNNGDDAELFPGSYPGMTWRNGAHVYMNPGVYTFTGDLTSRGGYICIYGAPACDQGESPATPGSALTSVSENCATASFSSINSGNYYYLCAPYGQWDQQPPNGTNGPVSLPSQPYFYNAKTGSNSTIPLNGVTLYMNGGNVDMNGNGYDEVLAAPNACPGLSNVSSGATQVPWTSGSYNATYSYPTNSIPNTDGTSTSYTSTNWSAVYPNTDWSDNGECNNGLEAWSGEFTSPQHLQFLFWSQSSSTTMKFNGGGRQNFFGDMYNPNGSFTVTGNGGGSGGPPWLYGQSVAGTATVTGNGGTTIDYRPCVGGATPCATGNGTSLIE